MFQPVSKKISFSNFDYKESFVRISIENFGYNAKNPYDSYVSKTGQNIYLEQLLADRFCYQTINFDSFDLTLEIKLDREIEDRRFGADFEEAKLLQVEEEYSQILDRVFEGKFSKQTFPMLWQYKSSGRVTSEIYK